ncbi:MULTISPECIES: hypothetical protein [unclassified Streptomyces]|uniref:hypothetical protein n=1 Tax=unclassified Streptomyces TaxID=2593676 RepID=UPI0008DE2C57|nr:MULTISPECIES: hypothetical protein [unclassified Streptomyces]OII68573.1 hypothetical protein BJP39_20870 [Streptomyces sp. CC77]
MTGAAKTSAGWTRAGAALALAAAVLSIGATTAAAATPPGAAAGRSPGPAVSTPSPDLPEQAVRAALHHAGHGAARLPLHAAPPALRQLVNGWD